MAPVYHSYSNRLNKWKQKICLSVYDLDARFKLWLKYERNSESNNFFPDSKQSSAS